PPVKRKKKVYDKADLDTVKRKLDFGTPSTSKSANVDEEIISLNLETTLKIQDSPSSNIESPSLNNRSAGRSQSHNTQPLSDSFQSTIRFFFMTFSPILQLVRKCLFKSQNGSPTLCRSRHFKEARACPSRPW